MAWFLVGLLIGVVTGFLVGCYCAALAQQRWAEAGKIKIGEKIYRLEEDV